MQEGWDGIKSGYTKKTVAQPQQQLSLTEQRNNNENESKKSCCS